MNFKGKRFKLSGCYEELHGIVKGDVTASDVAMGCDSLCYVVHELHHHLGV